MNRVPVTNAEYNRRYRERHPGRHLQSQRAFRERQRAKRKAEKAMESVVFLTIGGGAAVVPLNDGRVGLIDAADVSVLLPCNWYAARLGRGGHTYVVGSTRDEAGKVHHPLLHRLLTGALPGQSVDHKNGNTLDNRRENIRVCTQTYNNANQHKVRGRVPFKGVTTCDGPRPYMAQARKDGKNHNLGCYADPRDAARAYDAKAKELFGEFARTNESLGLLQPRGGVSF